MMILKCDNLFRFNENDKSKSGGNRSGLITIKIGDQTKYSHKFLILHSFWIKG